MSHVESRPGVNSTFDNFKAAAIPCRALRQFPDAALLGGPRGKINRATELGRETARRRTPSAETNASPRRAALVFSSVFSRQ